MTEGFTEGLMEEPQLSQAELRRELEKELAGLIDLGERLRRGQSWDEIIKSDLHPASVRKARMVMTPFERSPLENMRDACAQRDAERGGFER